MDNRGNGEGDILTAMAGPCHLCFHHLLVKTQYVSFYLFLMFKWILISPFWWKDDQWNTEALLIIRFDLIRNNLRLLLLAHVFCEHVCVRSSVSCVCFDSIDVHVRVHVFTLIFPPILCRSILFSSVVCCASVSFTPLVLLLSLKSHITVRHRQEYNTAHTHAHTLW